MGTVVVGTVVVGAAVVDGDLVVDDLAVVAVSVEDVWLAESDDEHAVAPTERAITIDNRLSIGPSLDVTATLSSLQLLERLGNQSQKVRRDEPNAVAERCRCAM